MSLQYLQQRSIPNLMTFDQDTTKSLGVAMIVLAGIGILHLLYTLFVMPPAIAESAFVSEAMGRTYSNFRTFLFAFVGIGVFVGLLHLRAGAALLRLRDVAPKQMRVYALLGFLFALLSIVLWFGMIIPDLEEAFDETIQKTQSDYLLYASMFGSILWALGIGYLSRNQSIHKVCENF